MQKRHAGGSHALGRSAQRGHDDIDAGLVALREATTAYSRLREELLEERNAGAELERRAAALAESVAALQEREAAAAARESALRAQVARLQEESRGQEKRAAALLASVQEMHRALFQGTTADHVLMASLDVTDAERGYYVADEPAGLRVRAIRDVPARVGDAPSPFIEGIVRTVLDSGDAVHWTADSPPDGLLPDRDEQFREGVAVPVTMRGGPCGVIIALDRDGEFHEEDVATLLNVGTEAGVAMENARLRTDLQQAYTSTIAMLADTVSAKDPYTQGHCEQVSQYARLAAERLKLSTEERRIACYAALLHDVGKIGVSDGVLNKPGPLIAEERKLVEAHVRIGHDLLVGIPALREVAAAILYHHERWDGTGYPEGRAGEEIPIASRIVSVVDAYCAMLDKRSYKEAFSPERARAELIRCAGSQFDPQVVEVVLAAIDDADAAELAGGDTPAAHGGCGILPGMSTART
ncbi:MAG: diguanylate cyclase domain [Gemmatimonadetes bacterium]|jgi:HD-GYP domain-containing protein (c-di-GMP phosphodiesterase class II)|nr:diguanylate cyclase domain [Gemmatimonadota bacterium]